MNHSLLRYALYSLLLLGVGEVWRWSQYLNWKRNRT